LQAANYRAVVVDLPGDFGHHSKLTGGLRLS
jgi:hypothetical protein